MSNDVYSFSNELVTPIIDFELSKQIDNVKNELWFHGELDRKIAEDRIINNGEFLLRLTESDPKQFVLSTKWNGTFIHVIIKTDVDTIKKELVYFIDPKFKYPTLLELIKFHNKQQYPLSDSSGAVIFRPVDKNRQISNNGMLTLPRESKYRKSNNIRRYQNSTLSTSLTPSNRFPRSGSETQLNEQRFSSFVSMNKSLNDLTLSVQSEGPSKPEKPNFKRLATKFFRFKKPPIMKVRNNSLYNDNSDYTDYYQLKDNDAALERERVRRGLSKDEAVAVQSKTINFKTSDNYQESDSTSESTYIVNSGSNPNIDIYGLSSTDNIQNQNVDIYGMPTNKETELSSLKVTPTNSIHTADKKNTIIDSLNLKPFINYSLNSIYFLCCGPINSLSLDKNSINKASTFLLSKTDIYQNFCKHLVEELKRIFQIGINDMAILQFGYNSLFLSNGKKFVGDLKIRQDCLTRFVMATILCTNSIEKRGNLILFWLKCAEYMYTSVKDFFHFRSIVNAILSEQISQINGWGQLYRRPNTKLQSQMEMLRYAVADVTSMCSSDITRCIPDIVELHNQFFNDSSENVDLNETLKEIFQFYDLSEVIRSWNIPQQTFQSSDSWLEKVSSKMEQLIEIPFLKELVKTETILCMLLGRRDLTKSTNLIIEIDTLLLELANNARNR